MLQGAWVSKKTTTRGQEEEKNKKVPGLVFCQIPEGGSECTGFGVVWWWWWGVLQAPSIGGTSSGASWGTSGLLNNVWVRRVRGDSRHCGAKLHLCTSVSVSGFARLLEQEVCLTMNKIYCGTASLLFT